MKILQPRFTKPEWIYDQLAAAGWSLLVGAPLFVLHMITLDYEHKMHGMVMSFSISMTLSDIFRLHPLSLSLWLAMVYISALAIRYAFRRQSQMLVMHDLLTHSQTQALTDGLTGVWNRRGLDQILEKTIEHSKRVGKPFSIIMADVDGLKQYNDLHGHLASDDALRLIAQTIAIQLRSADAIARFGGDEFVIVCPGLGQNGVGMLITRFNSALVTAPLTVSFGSAIYPSDGCTSQLLVETADRQLYQAKKKHYNREEKKDDN
jgi:diguanylate cyclase (GGDEF)-like protein